VIGLAAQPPIEVPAKLRLKPTGAQAPLRQVASITAPLRGASRACAHEMLTDSYTFPRASAASTSARMIAPARRGHYDATRRTTLNNAPPLAKLLTSTIWPGDSIDSLASLS
jgi:hypothetical protein